MGTRGYYAYRFRGRYYILYRNFDCYAQGLGVWIVQSIPQDSDGYQKWLNAQRAKFAKWEQILDQEILSISKARLQGLHFSSVVSSDGQLHAAPSLPALLDDRLEAALLPCFRVPKKDLWIEYTYTIDLDREVFTMDNGIHFFFNKIPRDVWVQSLGFDDQWQRLAFPSLLPPDCIADLAVLRFAGKATEKITKTDMRQTQTSIIRPKGFLDFPLRLRHGPLLLVHFWDFVTTSLEGEMPFILRGLTPDDFAFREIAFAFISLAAGLSSTLSLVDRLRIQPSSSETWDGIILGDQSQNEVVVLSDLAIGHHAEGVPPGSAPDANTYWFQGAVIRLEADLTTLDRVEQATKHAIAFSQCLQCLKEPFDIVLLSIEHVILLHVVGTNVQRTETLPLLNIAVHYTEHPSRRYPEGALNQFMDAQKEGEERKERERKEQEKRQERHKKEWLKENKRMNGGEETVEEEEVEVEEKEDAAESQGDDSETDAADEDATVDRDAIEPWPLAYEGFFAMMHLFEAATVRSMAPEKAKEGIFPTEVYEMILEYVDDVTYQACAYVSRKFRRCCLTALRLVEDTVIHGLDPNPEATKSWDTTSFLLSHGTQALRLPYQLKPCYNGHTNRQDSTVWLIICGVPQRSSLLSGFMFLGYKISGPWYDVDHQHVPMEDGSSGYHRSVPAEVGSSHYWNRSRVLDELRPVAQMDMRQLHEVWDNIIQAYGMPRSVDLDHFNLPPHTKEIFVQTSHFLKICVGYIRIKRPDALVGLAESWDLVFQEAEVEIRERVKQQDYQQISVVVAVDLLAMLYRWNPETQKLQPTNPNRLNIFAEGDREIVEEFIIALAKPLAEQKELDDEALDKWFQERELAGEDDGEK
ncbi:hypothetical protein MMC18_006892 [Xylographa bjoerkii]|nr:hypothetical protein [Xylographa bjoerkii]